MRNKEFIRDIICQVLVTRKSKELIYSILDEFIPGYEPINLDYTGIPDDENYKFKSEDEMISFYVDTLNVQQTFYWQKDGDNPDKIMVGVNITNDNQIVFSLTFDGIKEKENEYFDRLKNFLNSEIGVVSYVDPADYEDGNDFASKYGLIK